MKVLCLALLLHLAPGAQDPAAPPEGVLVSDVGVGFQATSEIPNLPLRPGERRRPPKVGRTETWLPFEVTLENHGPEVDGTLLLQDAYKTGGLDVDYRKRVHLPPGARKHVRFPVFHRGGQAPRMLSFRDDRGGTIRLQGAERLDVPPPHTAGSTASVILMASESRSNFFHFLGRFRQDELPQTRYLFPVLPAELPTLAIEYHGIDVVALDDIPLDSLESAQQDALRQFVARGGTLVVSVLRQAERVRQAKLADLMPGLPDGLRNLTDVEALRVATGYPCHLDRPLAMTTFALVPGARGWDPAAQVLAHRRYERGVVVACGFPLSSSFLESWPGAPRFLEILAETREETPVPICGTFQNRGLRADLALALKEALVRTIPPFRAVVWTLLGYLAAAALLPYLFFRRFQRLEWSWALVLGIAITGAGAVYQTGQSYLRKDSVAYRISVIDGGAAAGPHLRHNFWSLFTARGDRLNLSFEDPTAIPYPLGTELRLRGSEDTAGLSIGYDDVRLSEFRTYAQDSSLFETTDQVVLQAPLELSVRQEGGQATFRLKTDPGLSLRRAWIVSPQGQCEVPEFPGTQTVVPIRDHPLEQAIEHLAAGKDLLLQNAVRVLLLHASTRCRATGGRTLLYLYDSAPSLKGQKMPERGLDFGLLDIEGTAPAPTTGNWECRRLTNGLHDSSLMDGVFSPEGVLYSLVLREVPPDCRVEDIRFNSVGSLALELFDPDARSWKRVSGTAALGAAGLVHQPPLGSAFALLRARWDTRSAAPPEASPYWGTALPPTAVQAVSRIERKAP